MAGWSIPIRPFYAYSENCGRHKNSRQIFIDERYQRVPILSGSEYTKIIMPSIIGLLSLSLLISLPQYFPLSTHQSLQVFAQDWDAYFPDKLLTDSSDTEDTDSNQSQGTELPLPSPVSLDSQGQDCVPSTLQNNNECFLTYENSTYGVKINYPSTWVRVTPYSDEAYTTVFVEEFDKPDSSAYVIVGVDYFNFNATPTTYLARLMQNYRTQLEDFTLLSSDLNFGQLAGIPGYEVLYTYTVDSGEVILTRQLGSVIPGTASAYQITYSAEVSEFPQYEEVVNRMIDSVELHLVGANVTAPPNLADLDYFLHIYDGGVI